MSSDELRATYKIARVRIIVERAIGRLKKWAQLRGPLIISDLERLDVELAKRVATHLCRFSSTFISRLHD